VHCTQPSASTHACGQSIAVCHWPAVHVWYDAPEQRCAPSGLQSISASPPPPSGRELPDGPHAAMTSTKVQYERTARVIPSTI
jgi:hypothetical protein